MPINFISFANELPVVGKDIRVATKEDPIFSK